MYQRLRVNLQPSPRLHKFHALVEICWGCRPCHPGISINDELSTGKRRFLPRKTMSYDPELTIVNTTTMCETCETSVKVQVSHGESVSQRVTHR